ncbi:MAG: hypothetical protein ACXABK_05335, partial [Candidatus Heimdallarchaeaceae archaeon]
KCGHCGKSIGESKKTCGATMAFCKICKLPLHPHCLGEHRFMHRNQDLMVKNLNEDYSDTVLTKISKFFRNLFTSAEK